MKSIYEASVAYGREHQGTVNIEDFEAGANYVLEQIESLMNDVSDEYPRFQQGTIIQGRLIRLLKQLKK